MNHKKARFRCLMLVALWLPIILWLSVAFAKPLDAFENPSAALTKPIVIYPRPESTDDTRASYPVALLNLCAQNSENGFILQASTFKAQQGRNIRQLSQQKGLDVLWAVTNEERERILRPIRIPIDRGLIGWRLLLIRKEDTALFNAIKDREDLAALRAGQGHDWPDVEVLRSNQFSIVTSTTYEGLFHMLARGHIHYFPRSVSEIWPEAGARHALGIKVQDTLIIHYPEALYFFVNKSNEALAETLTACLQTATLDGSLRALFYEYYQSSIERSKLRQRNIIELDNPLPHQNATLLSDIYWFNPQEIQ